MTKKHEARVKGISEGLTAQERGLLVLRSWKEGKEEDPAWRSTMPEEQVLAFNRYIHLTNGVNRGLGLLLLAIVLETDKLSLRLGWLAESALWAITTTELRDYVALEAKEPITESEHRERVERARAEYEPVADLAGALVYRYVEWEEEDVESWDERDGLIVKEASWAKVRRVKERELAELVAEGVLQGRGSGRRLKVNVGCFYDWLGEDTPVRPDVGFEFEVVPDDQADDVPRRRKARERAFEELERSPGLSVLHASFWPEEVRPMVELQPKGKLDDLVELHKGILREGIERQWRQLRAMEVVVGEAEEAFGEDPCVPDVRHKIDHTRERLADLHGEAQAYLGPFELPEPDEDEVAEVRAVAERAG